MPPERNSNNIPWHLILIFVLLAVGIGGASYSYYRDQKETTKRVRYGDLSGIAKLKVNEISRWRQERLADAQVIATNQFIIKSVDQWFTGPNSSEARQTILDWMTFLNTKFDYRSILLLDPKGSVRLSVSHDPEGQPVDGFVHALATEASRTKQVILSDLHTDKTGKDIYLDLLVPLIIRAGSRTHSCGILLLRIDPRQFLYPLIQTWPTPSQTAETLIVRREGDYVVFLNELRHKKNTALTLRLPLSEKGLPAAMAARGDEGVVEGLDYRGVPVLAAVQKIPDSPWSLVAKVDSAEVYASLRERLLFTMGLVGALMAVAGVSLGFIWRHKHAQYYRSQYEAEVRHNALLQRYEYLTRHANDIILLLDRQGRVVEANDRALASYRYTRDELLQLHIRDLRAPHTASAVETEMKATHSADGSVFETMHRRKDGTVFPVEVSSRIVEIEGEGFFQDIIRDITERKRAEKKLKQALADLERSNKELEQFAYVASHDLQEPLRKVASFTELLAKRYEGKLDRNADRYIEYIVDGAKRMHILINDLLAYSRVGTSTEKYVRTDCGEVITRVLDDMRKTIRESGAAVTHDKLPTVATDPTQIGRVFQNLIANAIKFRRDEPPRIHISARHEGKEWIFSVRDNGIGIQPQFFDRIFLMFQRLHTRAEYPGTGIGLAICKKIIENHGGHIWLESEVGGGSTFYFSIPEKTGGV